MSIRNDLKNFIEVFNKDENSMGVMKFSDVVLNRDEDSVKLEGEVLYFYEHTILIENPAFGGELYIQVIEEKNLKSILSGWLVDEGDSNWTDDYVIFSVRDGDVLFCDLSDNKSPVYGSIQKRNYKISDSLSVFLRTYSRVICIGMDYFNGDLTDDDFNFNPNYINMVRTELDKNLPEELAKNFLYFFFG